MVCSRVFPTRSIVASFASHLLSAPQDWLSSSSELFPEGTFPVYCICRQFRTETVDPVFSVDIESRVNVVLFFFLALCRGACEVDATKASGW